MKICYYEDLKLVYYCIDKCASTSIYEALTDHAKSEVMIWWDKHCLEPSSEADKQAVTADPEALHFTVIRNPWDRYVSLYCMLQRQAMLWPPIGKLHGWFARYEESILNCLRAEQPFLALISFIAGQSLDEMDSHWTPQYAGLPLEDKRLHIVRFESLQNDLKELLSGHGVNIFPLPVRNDSGNRRHSLFYCKQSISLVEQVYREDIKRFGYRFQR